jgi:AcrR family transcriptional regulator
VSKEDNTLSDQGAAILAAAMQLANLKRFTKVTRNDVAKKAKCAPGLVSYYFTSMPLLRKKMVEKAVEDKNLKIVGEALADRHSVAMKAPEALRKAAAMQMVG